MRIIEITQNEFNDWLDLAMKLWPDSSVDDRETSLLEILHSPCEAGFLIKDDSGTALGFINLSLRADYVPGATQSSVAFVEGIYVKDNYRNQGIGKALIQFAEQWALERGGMELASDALVENTVSHESHKQMGFQEVERIVAFIKPQ